MRSAIPGPFVETTAFVKHQKLDVFTDKVSGNVIDRGAEHAIMGMEWEAIVSTDLAADTGRYPNVVVDGNSAG